MFWPISSFWLWFCFMLWIGLPVLIKILNCNWNCLQTLLHDRLLCCHHECSRRINLAQCHGGSRKAGRRKTTMPGWARHQNYDTCSPALFPPSLSPSCKPQHTYTPPWHIHRIAVHVQKLCATVLIVNLRSRGGLWSTDDCPNALIWATVESRRGNVVVLWLLYANVPMSFQSHPKGKEFG